MGANAEDIERLGVSIAVLVSSPVTFTPLLACRYPYTLPLPYPYPNPNPSSDQLTRVCANLCVKLCGPPQPVLVCSDEESATAWARAQHAARS